VAIGAAIREALGGPRDWELPERWDDAVSGRVVGALAGGIVPPRGYTEE
jgi:hypothetical protein